MPANSKIESVAAYIHRVISVALVRTNFAIRGVSLVFVSESVRLWIEHWRRNRFNRRNRKCAWSDKRFEMPHFAAHVTLRSVCNGEMRYNGTNLTDINDLRDANFMSAEQKAAELGLKFTKVTPGYLNLCAQTGNLLMTSGHASDLKGKLGDGLSVEQGYEAAKDCADQNPQFRAEPSRHAGRFEGHQIVGLREFDVGIHRPAPGD